MAGGRARYPNGTSALENSIEFGPFSSDINPLDFLVLGLFTKCISADNHKSITVKGMLILASLVTPIHKSPTRPLQIRRASACRRWPGARSSSFFYSCQELKMGGWDSSGRWHPGPLFQFRRHESKVAWLLEIRRLVGKQFIKQNVSLLLTWKPFVCVVSTKNAPEFLLKSEYVQQIYRKRLSSLSPTFQEYFTPTLDRQSFHIVPRSHTPISDQLVTTWFKPSFHCILKNADLLSSD